MKSSFPASDKAKSSWVDAFANVALFAGVIGMAMSPAPTRADDRFMQYETEQARIAEANGECDVAGMANGQDRQDCVDYYFCQAWQVGCDAIPFRAESGVITGMTHREICDGEGCATVLNQ